MHSARVVSHRWMRAIFIAVVFLSAGQANGEIQFAAMLSNARTELFALRVNEDAEVRWGTQGDSIGGYVVASYDQRSETLTLIKGQQSLILRLPVARVRSGTNESVSGKDNSEKVLEAYYAMFKQRLRAEFTPPPGSTDDRKARVVVRSMADGAFVSGTLAQSSGNRDFDTALLNALRRVRMPLRPDQKSETIVFDFKYREPVEDKSTAPFLRQYRQ